MSVSTHAAALESLTRSLLESARRDDWASVALALAAYRKTAGRVHAGTDVGTPDWEQLRRLEAATADLLAEATRGRDAVACRIRHARQERGALAAYARADASAPRSA